MPLNNMIQNATQTLIDNLEELTALDQAIGDGDHGLNMKRGAQAIQAKLSEMQGASLNECLKTMGKTCVAMIGGSSGPIFGTLLLTLGKELPERFTAQDLAAALRTSIDALTRLGKAEVGQKTLLDVLDPVQKVLAQGGDDLLTRVHQCAFASAAATARIQALGTRQNGRARNYG